MPRYEWKGFIIVEADTEDEAREILEDGSTGRGGGCSMHCAKNSDQRRIDHA